jgi:hypothetical protein
MGHPQADGVTRYLDNYLLDEYSVSVKKLHHIECIKLPTFTKYQRLQKNHLETQTNAQNNKRQNLP